MMAVRKRAKPTKKYLITKQRALKKRWRGLPKEEKSEFRRLVKILAAIFFALAILYYIGINLLTNIGSFWTSFRGRGGDLFYKDTLAPPPPSLSPLSLYTNKETVKIKGYAEAGAEVILFVNKIQKGTTVAEKGGNFSFPSVNLKEGENQITAVAKDAAGNESLTSSVLKIIFDQEPPELIIKSPKEGQNFSGENNKVRVRGKTEPGATVKVNKHQATVLGDGTFSFTFIAEDEGQITLTITAVDRAGNKTTEELTVNYLAG